MSTIVVGAVAYKSDAVTIWDAIREFFRARPHQVDYVLFSNYDAQEEALMKGLIDVAWNTPVAWLKCKKRSNGTARALAMRDADVGFTTVLVARPGSGVKGPKDLKGKTLAVGSRDSGQAAILPLHFVKKAGLSEGRDYKSLRFDIDVGLHGDTGDSETEVLKAVLERRADAGALGDSSWARFVSTGAVEKGAVEVVWTSPPYCHCNFTALASFPDELAKSFTDGLLAMDANDPNLREMMELEGLKRWVSGRTTGYEELDQAMTDQGMYETPKPAATAFVGGPAAPPPAPHIYGLGADAQAVTAEAAKIAADVVAKNAQDVDQKGRFPKESIDALAKAGRRLSGARKLS
ncbi:PhnD/SsuA/transferrin family substrate-binding protein [bacterium]|nr:PhnD/SsuA/transferrin family substrate-binding protein [bacterium]